MVKRLPIPPLDQAGKAAEAIAAMAQASTDRATTVDTAAAAITADPSATGASAAPAGGDEGGAFTPPAPDTDARGSVDPDIPVSAASDGATSETGSRSLSAATRDAIRQWLAPAHPLVAAAADVAEAFGLEPEQVLGWRFGSDEAVAVTTDGRKLRIRRGSAEVEEL